jgi:hypothetical protein
MANGQMPDISQLNSGAIGTNLIFGENRKRSIEVIEDWTSPNTEMSNGRTPQMIQNQHQQQQQQQQGGPSDQRREAKRMKGQ